MSIFDGEVWNKLSIRDGDYTPEIDYIVRGGYVFKHIEDVNKYCKPNDNLKDGVRLYRSPMHCLECGFTFEVASSWEYMYLIAEHLSLEHPEIFFEVLLMDEVEER